MIVVVVGVCCNHRAFESVCHSFIAQFLYDPVNQSSAVDSNLEIDLRIVFVDSDRTVVD